MTESFGIYFLRLVRIVVSSSLVLGSVLGLLVLVRGGITANIDLTLEFEAIDGLWIMLGFPVFITVICLLVSPLSYFVHALISRGYRSN